MDEGSWLSWLIIALLVACASYFATVETAFSSVSRIKVKSEMDRGDRRAKKALNILDHFDKAITTILIGTNIVHIVTAALVLFRKGGNDAMQLGKILTSGLN